jgi:hypothetical protein
MQYGNDDKSWRRRVELCPLWVMGNGVNVMWEVVSTRC